MDNGNKGLRHWTFLGGYESATELPEPELGFMCFGKYGERLGAIMAATDAAKEEIASRLDAGKTPIGGLGYPEDGWLQVEAPIGKLTPTEFLNSVRPVVSNGHGREGLPGRDFLDMRVTYEIGPREGTPYGEHGGREAVTSELLEAFGVSEGQVHKAALFNLRVKNTYTFAPMHELLASMQTEALGEEAQREAIEAARASRAMTPIFVLSNSDGVCGAAEILDEELMRNIAKDLGRYAVLPSSIHEVIVVPLESTDVKDDLQKSALDEMIQSVNATNLAPWPDEILSDHCYVFDTRKRRLTIPSEGPIKSEDAVESGRPGRRAAAGQLRKK